MPPVLRIHAKQFIHPIHRRRHLLGRNGSDLAQRLANLLPQGGLRALHSQMILHQLLTQPSRRFRFDPETLGREPGKLRRFETVDFTARQGSPNIFRPIQHRQVVADKCLNRDPVAGFAGEDCRKMRSKLPKKLPVEGCGPASLRFRRRIAFLMPQSLKQFSLVSRREPGQGREALSKLGQNRLNRRGIGQRIDLPLSSPH